MFLNSHRAVFTFHSWLGVVLVFRISILKIFKSHQNFWHRVTHITCKLRKTFEKLFRSYSELLSKCGEKTLQEYFVFQGNSYPVFYGDIVYNIRVVKDAAIFVSSSSKIIEHLPRRRYDPVIIDRTIGLLLGLSTALYNSLQKHCILTNQVVRTIWQELFKHPKKETRPWSSYPLIVSRDIFSLLIWVHIPT